MSILYAAAVLAQEIRSGTYPGMSESDIFLFDPGLDFPGRPEEAVEELGRLLRHRRPSFVGIGTTSYGFFWACRMAREIKSWEGSCAVVVGGPHEDERGASLPGGSIVDYGDIFDFSIQGDGELLFKKLFEILLQMNCCIEAAKEVLANTPTLVGALGGSGAISFRYDNGVRSLVTGGRFRPGLAMRSQVPLDLDRLPYAPRWLLEEGHKYLFDIFRDSEGRRTKPTAQVMTTRGCLYGCDFCTERGAVSCRGVESVLDELFDLREQGYEAVFFDDSTFHTYTHLADLQLALEAHRDQLDLEFGCLTRVDSVLAAESWMPLERLWDAGFTYFYLGIEHDDDDVLIQMHKGYSRQDIHDCLNLLANRPFRLGVSVLFGFEAETSESRRRTLRLVAEHPSVVLVNLNVLAFHPGATLVRREGLALRYDVPAPNRSPVWDLFEEGRWYHPRHVTVEYARAIHQLVREVDSETGGRLIRKLKRGRNVLGPRSRVGEPFADEQGAGRPLRVGDRKTQELSSPKKHA